MKASIVFDDEVTLRDLIDMGFFAPESEEIKAISTKDLPSFIASRRCIDEACKPSVIKRLEK